MSRVLSHSEASALYDCQARWDFRYGGKLAGSCLKPRETAAVLREGRIWGVAVAAWHASTERDPELRVAEAGVALFDAVEQEAAEQPESACLDPDAQTELVGRHVAMLAHYASTAEHLPITRLEHRLEVAIPSRTGGRSNRYRLLCLLDGVHVDTEGRTWLVEFKLRGQLSAFEQIVLSRQTRWYAWAWREATGVHPDGVIVDERLKAVPAEVKRNRDERPSAVQSCTPEAYIEAGGKDDGVIAKLRDKRWQVRHPLLFMPGELDEAGEQLVSTAQLVHDLESGRLYPVRNPSKFHCGGCDFRPVCQTPTDTELVDALFVREPAKRDREEVHR